MDCRKWIEKYSTDCRMKYNSSSTYNNYISCVNAFLNYFDTKFREPKEIPTIEIEKWLLLSNTINNSGVNKFSSNLYLQIGHSNFPDKHMHFKCI